MTVDQILAFADRAVARELQHRHRRLWTDLLIESAGLDIDELEAVATAVEQQTAAWWETERARLRAQLEAG